MHKLLPRFIFASLLLAAAPLSATTLFLSASPGTTVAPGQTVDLLVRIDDPFSAPRAGDEVIGFGFNVVNSAPGVLLYQGFTLGPLFDPTILPPAGTAVYGLPNFPPGSISDPGGAFQIVLATLHFKAIAPGTSTIGATSDLLTFDQGLQYLSSAANTFDIEGTVGINVTPEPSAMLMLSSGLLVLAWARRRIGKPSVP